MESSPPEIFGSSSNYFREIAKNVLNKEEIDEFMPIDFDYRKATFDNELNTIWIFDYIYWNREDEKKALKVLGWSRGDFPSDIHIDCSLHFLCSFYHLKKWGGLRTSLHYSKMIRRRNMKREEALKLLKAESKEDYKSIFRIKCPQKFKH